MKIKVPTLNLPGIKLEYCISLTKGILGRMPDGVKVLLLLAFAVVNSTPASAQFDPQFSQNMYNRLPFNPGYAGSSGGTCATLFYRKQWVGFQGAPETYNLAVDALVPEIHGGIGGVVTYDKIGYNSYVNAKASYAYRMRVFRDARLALGLDAGIVQLSVDRQGLINAFKAGNPNAPDDPSIPGGSEIKPDFGFGAYFNTSDFYLGFSVQHLFTPKISLIDGNNAVSTFTIGRHYYIMGGYNYALNRSLTLKPAIFIKSDFVSTQFDANVTLLFNNLVWGGVSYRLDDAFVAMIGMNVTSDLKIGYSYDITTSAIRVDSQGSHELMLRYCFKPLRKRPAYMNRTVRYL